jgi:hypothetical protein
VIIFYLICALHGDYEQAEGKGKFISEESCRAKMDECVALAWKQNNYQGIQPVYCKCEPSKETFALPEKKN